jgi:hypothetical protein
MKFKITRSYEDMCPMCHSDDIDTDFLGYKDCEDDYNSLWEDIYCNRCGWISRQEYKLVYLRTRTYLGENESEKNYNKVAMKPEKCKGR